MKNQTRRPGNGSNTSRLRRYFIGVPLIIMTYLGLIFLAIYPHRPVDWIGWVILIFIGIPITCFLEWIGEYLAKKDSKKSDSEKKLSLKRIMIVLLIFLFLIGASIVCWMFLGDTIKEYFT
jgi:hypothetical protein